jgi:hypothetical protein
MLKIEGVVAPHGGGAASRGGRDWSITFTLDPGARSAATGGAAIRFSSQCPRVRRLSLRGRDSRCVAG